jgi:hypothetical protein
MNLEDKLSDITANLLGFEKYSVFLERLFSQEIGKWTDIVVLCRDITEIEEQLAGLEESLEGTLRVTWLEYPQSAYGPGYAVVIFFSEEPHWASVALYNKQHFLEQLTRRTDDTKK